MRAARTAHRAAHRAAHHGARRATGAVVLATILALLAACTDGATHERPVPTTITTTTAPTPSPTPEPTPTPTSVSGLDFSDIDLTVPPPRPAALDEGPSPEAADAIARYFMLLFPYMYVTHDLDAFEALSHPTCDFCSSSLDDARRFIKEGITTEHGAITIHDTAVETIDIGYYIVSMTYSQDWSRETGREGEAVSEDDGVDHFASRVHVAYLDGEWKIAGVVRGDSTT